VTIFEDLYKKVVGEFFLPKISIAIDKEGYIEGLLE
jgi:hypothetical protein